MKGCFPICQLYKAGTVPNRHSGKQKADMLITCNTSASFATSLVRTKTLRFPPMEEGSKMSVNNHGEEGNSPARLHFQIMGTFPLLVQSFIPTSKATCSVKA